MPAGIYKSGQGYWTRMMSAIGLSLLVVMGVVWLWKLLATVRFGDIEPIYIQAASAVIALTLFGIIGYQLIGRNPRLADFMIATEGEMKKVNWSGRREILGSTWVVIGLTIFIGILCFVFDLLYHAFFQWIQVLETQS